MCHWFGPADSRLWARSPSPRPSAGSEDQPSGHLVIQLVPRLRPCGACTVIAMSLPPNALSPFSTCVGQNHHILCRAKPTCGRYVQRQKRGDGGVDAFGGSPGLVRMRPRLGPVHLQTPIQAAAQVVDAGAVVFQKLYVFSLVHLVVVDSILVLVLFVFILVVCCAHRWSFRE